MKSYLCFFKWLLPYMISTNNPQEIVDGNNKFAFKLYHQMQGGTNTRKFNLCSSIMYGD